MLCVIYVIYGFYILKQKVSYTSFILMSKHNVLIEYWDTENVLIFSTW